MFARGGVWADGEGGGISDNDTKSPWPMTAIAAAAAAEAGAADSGARARSCGVGGRAQAQAETGKCFFTIKMMDDIINNVGVRPNRGFPVVVYFDINEILLSFFLLSSFGSFFCVFFFRFLPAAAAAYFGQPKRTNKNFFLIARGAQGCTDNLAKKTPNRSNSPAGQLMLMQMPNSQCPNPIRSQPCETSLFLHIINGH